MSGPVKIGFSCGRRGSVFLVSDFDRARFRSPGLIRGGGWRPSRFDGCPPRFSRLARPFPGRSPASNKHVSFGVRTGFLISSGAPAGTTDARPRRWTFTDWLRVVRYQRRAMFSLLRHLSRARNFLSASKALRNPSTRLDIGEADLVAGQSDFSPVFYRPGVS